MIGPVSVIVVQVVELGNNTDLVYVTTQQPQMGG